MDRSLLYLLIAMVVIYIIIGNITEEFVENFTSFNDPQIYAESCKGLVKEKATVDKLMVDNKCDVDPMTDVEPVTNLGSANLFSAKKKSNIDSINQKLGCKNLTDKIIMLRSEQPSWCDRVGQIDRAGIVVGAPGVVPQTLVEGPEYMQTQYTSNFGALQPNDVGSSAYASFANMDVAISNGGLATL